MIKVLLTLLLLLGWAGGALADLCTTSQACWKFSEGSGTTTADSSGNSNTLTFGSSGHPAWSSTVPNYAVSGSASHSVLYADGDILSAPASSTLNNLTSGMTATAWVYNTDTSGGLGYRIFDKDASGSEGWLVLNKSCTTAYCLEFIAKFSSTELDRGVNTNGHGFSLNAWHFIAITWDGSTTATNVHIYVDNSEISYDITSNGSGTYQNDSGSSLYIGNRSDEGRSFIGYITDVQVFNSVLSSTNLTKLYNYGPTGGGASSPHVSGDFDF